VSVGLRHCAVVLTTLTNPMIAVRSDGNTIAAKKAERGATSIDWVQERRTRKRRDRWTSLGIGMSARKTAEGRWVKTMVLTLPKRLARLEAISIEAAAMMEVVKKMDPRMPSERL